MQVASLPLPVAAARCIVVRTRVVVAMMMMVVSHTHARAFGCLCVRRALTCAVALLPPVDCAFAAQTRRHAQHCELRHALLLEWGAD